MPRESAAATDNALLAPVPSGADTQIHAAAPPLPAAVSGGIRWRLRPERRHARTDGRRGRSRDGARS